MFIWPHSATLAEDGTTREGFGGALGGGAAAGGGASTGGGGGTSATMLAAPNAGEIVLNRAESAALAALETEEDEAHGLRRAQAESGLNRQQVEKLKRRATTALAKGFTLKGLGFVKKPLASAPDEPGLARKAVKGKDETDFPKPSGPVKSKAATKEALVERTVKGPELYTCPEIEDYGVPTPASMSQPEWDPGRPAEESNTMTTLAAMLRRNRRRKATTY